MTPEEQWLLQKEKGLAWLRVGFSLAAVLVLQINPARAQRFFLLSQFSLYSFLIYSLLILYLIRGEKGDSKKIGLATTVLDLFWISLIILSTGGSRAPFFVYYLFPVITASSRYGIKGGLLAALVGTVLYDLIRFSTVWHRPLAIDTVIIRNIYLFVLAYIFGFLSEFENKQSQKLMALYRTAGEAAAQEERRRIARELHDRLLQVLASLTLRLESCRRHLMDSPKELARELELLEETSRGSIGEIRRFLAGQETRSLAPGTLLETLREEMRFLRDGLGVRLILESEPEELTLPPDVEREVFYVLREGLMNVARHSRASEAELLLKKDEGLVVGSLRDNGVGFDPGPAKNGGGFGLSSMEQRIKKLGGQLTIEASPGKGTAISFRLPLKKPPAAAAGG